MDPELIAYFDANFGSITRRLEDMQGQIDRGFDETQSHIRENRTAIEANRTAIEANRTAIEANRTAIKENRTAIKENRSANRETRVLVEEVRSKIETVAEGFVLHGERMERDSEAANTARKQDRAHFEGLMKALFVDLTRRDDALEERIERLETA